MCEKFVNLLSSNSKGPNNKKGKGYVESREQLLEGPIPSYISVVTSSNDQSENIPERTQICVGTQKKNNTFYSY